MFAFPSYSREFFFFCVEKCIILCFLYDNKFANRVTRNLKSNFKDSKIHKTNKFSKKSFIKLCLPYHRVWNLLFYSFFLSTIQTKSKYKISRPDVHINIVSNNNKP